MLTNLGIKWRFCLGILLAIMASGSSCNQPQSQNGNQQQHQTSEIRLAVLNAPASIKSGEELSLKVKIEGAQGAVHYTWTKQSGPELTVPAKLPANAQTSELTFKAPLLSGCGSSDSLRFRLEAIDETGRTGLTEFVVGIEGQDCQGLRLSIYNLPAKSVNGGDQIALQVKADDASGDVKYTWTQTEGPSAGTLRPILKGVSGNSELFFKAPHLSPCGSLDKLGFRIEAEDAAGQIGSLDFAIDVQAWACQEIKLSVIDLPKFVNGGDQVTLQIKTENARGGVTYAWTQTEGTSVSNLSPTVNVPELAFRSPSLPCGQVSDLKFKLLASDVFGQSGELEVSMQMDQAWCTFSSGLLGNSGLASNTINSLALANDGRLWIGTPNGLNKLENLSWSSFYSGIFSSNIGALAFDETDNSLWMFSRYRNIAGNKDKMLQKQRYENGSLIADGKYDFRENVRTILPYPSSVLVGKEKGVRVFRNPVKNSFDLPKLDKEINAIAFDEDYLWYGGSEGVSVYKGSAFERHFDGKQWGGVNNRDIRTMGSDLTFSDPHRNFYIGLASRRGAAGGMVRARVTFSLDVDWKHFTVKDYPEMAGDDIRKIVIGSNHQVWIATSSGLSSFDPTTETWKSYQSATVKGSGGFTTDDLVDLAYDKVSNVLWIATNGGGLTRLSLNMLN